MFVSLQIFSFFQHPFSLIFQFFVKKKANACLNIDATNSDNASYFKVGLVRHLPIPKQLPDQLQRIGYMLQLQLVKANRVYTAQTVILLNMHYRSRVSIIQKKKSFSFRNTFFRIVELYCHTFNTVLCIK